LPLTSIFKGFVAASERACLQDRIQILDDCRQDGLSYMMRPTELGITLTRTRGHHAHHGSTHSIFVLPSRPRTPRLQGRRRPATNGVEPVQEQRPHIRSREVQDNGVAHPALTQAATGATARAQDHHRTVLGRADIRHNRHRTSLVIIKAHRRRTTTEVSSLAARSHLLSKSSTSKLLRRSRSSAAG